MTCYRVKKLTVRMLNVSLLFLSPSLETPVTSFFLFFQRYSISMLSDRTFREGGNVL